MAILIRTDDLPPARRQQAWRHIVCDTLGPLDLRVEGDMQLQGEIGVGQLGAVGVASVQTATPHSVHRTRGLIRSDSPELYRVVLPVAGSPVLTQDGRTTRLAAGDFTIYDFTRPYELAYESAVRLAVLSVPRTLLPLPPATVATLTAVPVSGVGGAGALVAPVLRQLTPDLEGYAPATAARLSTVLLDLVTTALAERADVAPPPEPAQRALLLRIHAFIEQHLADPELSPGSVAAANHLSSRSLHRLFAGEHTTVAAWIRRRRLERVRRDLADPGLRSLPVSAIAATWGLPDAAQFSRLFRSAYGLPPSDYRRRCHDPHA